jgi:hypothetical protein
MCDLCFRTPCAFDCPNYNEDDDGFITCPTCNIHLHQGDIWYPEFDVCEFCISDFEKIVEIDEAGED